MQLNGSISDIPGIKIGHAQDFEALTGCTVVLCEEGAVAGVDQRGGAPGTRETDLLRPMHMVEKVHGVLLSGGSAFGLDAASGVVRYLEEKGIGVDVGVAKVPIIPGAILFDLDIGRSDIRPDAEMGYQACENATNQEHLQGNVGSGTGARLGSILGVNQAMKSGIGTCSMDLGDGVLIASIMVVNSFGDVVDPHSNCIIAGARAMTQDPLDIGEAGYFANTLELMKSPLGKMIFEQISQANTVIGVVATNAFLTKEQANKVAQMAQDGVARVIRPAHTMLDGDTIFALSTGDKNLDFNIVGAYAAEVVVSAIINAVQTAEPAGGLPSASGGSY